MPGAIRTGEWMRVGSLTLSVLMKGHVGGGPVSWSLWVQDGRSNLCRSKGTRRSECFGEYTALGKPEDGRYSVNLRRDLVEIKFFQLESLILAQNERWRQA